MSRYMEEKWSWIDGTHAMRNVVLDLLTDADLSFSPGGQNMTMGALCRELGEIEHSYIESLRAFKQDWIQVSRSSRRGISSLTTR